MRAGFRAALGFAITLALLWWVLRDVSPAFVLAELRMANLWWFGAAVVLATGIFALRAARWQIILRPVGVSVPFGPAWRATTIGMMVNNLVPARAGELARAVVLTREVPRVRLSAGVASLAVDRTFDAVVLLMLGALALLDPALPPTAEIGGRTLPDWAGSAAVLVLAVLVALYALVFFPGALVGVFDVMTRRLSARLQERGRAALWAFSEGLGALRSPRKFLLVFAWTVAHWIVGAAAFWLGFRAVGIEAPFSAAILVQTLIAFGVAIPAAPGFFGVFEAIAVVALGLYGIDRATAVTFAIGFHVLSFIPVTLLGLFYTTRLGLKVGELKAPAGGA